MAFGLLSQLLFNNARVLFQENTLAAGKRLVPLSNIGFFHLLSNSYYSLELARWIAVAALLVVVVGWRPRYTGVLHWWISFSFAAGTAVPEGGDQIVANIALLLIPVTLTDPRKWHWGPCPPVRLDALGQRVSVVVADSCLVMIRVQAALIYLNAAVAKLGSAEWKNGTAMYYWLSHPAYGMSESLGKLAIPALTNGPLVAGLTWGVIALELLLAAALVMEPRRYARLLIPGLVFHLAIVVGHGLFSFFFAMAGTLVLYLRPRSLPFPALLAAKSGASTSKRHPSLRPIPAVAKQ